MRFKTVGCVSQRTKNHVNQTTVGCCFQRTTKPNTQTKTFCRKAFTTLSGGLFFVPIFMNGALKTAPYEVSNV